MFTVTYLQNGTEHTTQVMAHEDELYDIFSRENKIIIEIKKQNILFQTRVNKTEIVAVFKALSGMLNAGKKLPESITAVIESFSPKSKMIPILTDIREKTTQGIQLSKCLEDHVGIFGLSTVAMISSGEKISKLAGTLRTVADNIVKSNEINKQIKKSMISPILGLITVISGMFIASVFIIPRITKGFAETGVQDRNFAVMILDNMTIVVPVFITIIVASTIGSFIFYKNNPMKAEKIILQIPFLKEMIFYREYYHVFNSLGNMLDAGIRIQNALPIVHKQAKIATIKDELGKAIGYIESGQPRRFADAFSSISTVEKTMLETSEKEGDLQEHLIITGQRFYELYMDKMQLLGPAISIFIKAIIISFIFLLFSAIFLPYLSTFSKIK